MDRFGKVDVAGQAALLDTTNYSCVAFIEIKRQSGLSPCLSQQNSSHQTNAMTLLTKRAHSPSHGLWGDFREHAQNC